jgi:phosphonoacetaldehyde hydrolase
MMFRVMEATDVYPGWAVVKVGDTPADMGEGRNAGTWCVGVLDSSNAVGLTREEFDALSPDNKRATRAAAAVTLQGAGAHCVINGLDDLPALIEDLDRRLAHGDRP